MAKPVADVRSWVTEETPHHLRLLSRLRERLVSSMNADANDKGTPSRDWCRAYQRYQTGYAAILLEERERVKLRLMLDKSGQQTLTDEEYEAELKQLALESLGTLPQEEIDRELERRGRAAAEMLVAEERDE